MTYPFLHYSTQAKTTKSMDYMLSRAIEIIIKFQGLLVFVKSRFLIMAIQERSYQFNERFLVTYLLSHS